MQVFAASRYRSQLLLISLVWIASRAVVLLAARSRIPFYWEVFEVKKLWEYGFFQRAGALINIQYLPGHLSDPEVFNYVNHPYPIIWVFALAYRVFGAAGMLAVSLFLGWAGCLLTTVILHQIFRKGPALLSSLLYVLAPSTLLFDADTNLVVLGSVIWPAATYIVTSDIALGESGRMKWLLGGVIFICGQISWFALVVLPGLLIIGTQSNSDLSGHILKPWKARFFVPIVIGGVCTLLVFMLQVLVYSSDLRSAFGYAFAHAGTEGGFFVSRARMIPFIVAKALLLVGPALIAGGVTGSICYAIGPKRVAIVRGALIGVVVVVAAALVLTRFFYRERTPYAYLVFPSVILTAYALEQARIWWYAAVSGLACIGLVYVCLQITSPVLSNADRCIGDFLRTTTNATDVVMTNLREQEFPFPSWDTGSRDTTMLVADRLLYYNIADVGQLRRQANDFHSQNNPPRLVFVRDAANPISADLDRELREKGEFVLRKSLLIPSEQESPTLRLRSIYWRMIGSPFAQTGKKDKTSQAREISLELYRIN